MERSDDVFRFLSAILEKEGNFEKVKAGVIACQFSTLKAFKNADFTKPLMRGGDNTKIRINENGVRRIKSIQNNVLSKVTLNENWVRFTVRRRGSAMIDNLKSIKLENINMNPFLINMLRLKTPEEVVRFNVYQSVTRSIVTSMGTALEQMAASGQGTRLGRRGEWYDVIKKKGNSTYWIQVKSGPNNINKDQAKAFATNFENTERKNNNFARLGITYGKKDLETLSLGIVKNYMKDWKKQLLVGREFWEFVSDQKDYHSKVLCWIDSEISKIHNRSMDVEINNLIKRILIEFKRKYGNDEKAVKKYVKESL